eukprot:480057_1
MNITSQYFSPRRAEKRKCRSRSESKRQGGSLYWITFLDIETEKYLLILVAANSESELDACMTWINGLIKDQFSRDALRQAQKSKCIFQDSYKPLNLPSGNTEILVIPADKVGTVIGRSGETIMTVQAQSKANVQFKR